VRYHPSQSLLGRRAALHHAPQSPPRDRGAVSTASLAGCPTPLWGEIPETVDGAEVTSAARHRQGTAARRLARDCYRVDLIEADLDADRLLLRLTTQDDPDWDGGRAPISAKRIPTISPSNSRRRPFRNASKSATATRQC